ncbi:hypothetical protein A343_0834, partial [Porphyromonas gingivalis JCVI SC001]
FEALSFFIFSLSKNHFAFLSIPLLLSPFPSFLSSPLLRVIPLTDHTPTISLFGRYHR